MIFCPFGDAVFKSKSVVESHQLGQTAAKLPTLQTLPHSGPCWAKCCYGAPVVSDPTSLTWHCPYRCWPDPDCTGLNSDLEVQESPIAQLDQGGTAPPVDLAVGAAAQTCQATCLPLFAEAAPGLGSAEMEVEAEEAGVDWWAAGGAGSTAGPGARAAVMMEVGAAAAAAAAAGVEVAVVEAAVFAQAGAGPEPELGTAAHYERWTEMSVVAHWEALSQQDLQMQQNSFFLPKVTPAGIFPC